MIEKQNYTELKRLKEEKVLKDAFYSDVRRIRRVAEYFFWLSFISLITWFIF